jgi:hypothetical protein
MPLGLPLPAQMEYLVKHGLFIASACNKMIRRALLQDLRFEKGVYSEDIVWCMDLAAKAASMDYVCGNFYCYRQRSHSITHLTNNKRCADLAKAVLDCFDRLETVEAQYEKLFLVYTAFQYGTFMLVQAQAKENQQQLVNRLARYQWILKNHGGNKKLLCLRLGCMALGYRRLCRLVRFVYGIKRK